MPLDKNFPQVFPQGRGKQGTGKQGTGNREQGIGNREQTGEEVNKGSEQ
jgi:hypothetical protein